MYYDPHAQIRRQRRGWGRVGGARGAKGSEGWGLGGRERHREGERERETDTYMRLSSVSEGTFMVFLGCESHTLAPMLCCGDI